jgi:hypothetical protein
LVAPPSYDLAGCFERTKSKLLEWRSSLETKQWCLPPVVRPAAGVSALLILKWSVAVV